MEGYLTDRPVEIEREEKGKNFFSHITLLAKDNLGLRNLWTLSSRAYIDGFYYKPLSHWNDLAKYSEGFDSD